MQNVISCRYRGTGETNASSDPLAEAKTKGAAYMRFQYTEKKVNLPENVHKYAEKKVMKL